MLHGLVPPPEQIDSKRLRAAIVKSCRLHAWITVELICILMCSFHRERRSKIYTESNATRKSLCTVMIGFTTSIYR